MLVLPEVQTMTPELLRKIKELVEAGATVIGPKVPPTKSPSLSGYPQCDEEVRQLVKELWGNGKIVTDKTPAEVLATRGVPPDFSSRNDSGQQTLRFIHQTIGATEVYFVASKNAQVQEVTCSFRVQDKRPELWNPETGQTEPAAVYDQAGSCLRVPIRFEPTGSVFVVFRADTVGTPNQTKSVAHDGQTNQRAVSPPQEIIGPWEVSFDAKWGGPDKTVSFKSLANWALHSEAGIRYYSGTATYRKTFRLADETKFRDPKSRIFLDLGRVAVIAEVKLNGRDLGIFWKTPFRVDITAALKSGENALEVRVTNLWVNRMIGDQQLPDDSQRDPKGILKQWPKWLLEGKPSPAGRYTFTTWQPWKKSDPLAESGLIQAATCQWPQPAPISFPVTVGGRGIGGHA